MGFRYFVIAAALIATVATAAHGQDKAPVMARAEQCLRDNVDRVVAADTDLNSATNFLLGYRCAETVEAAARYQRNLSYAGLYNMMSAFKIPGERNASATARATEAVDPETGEIALHPAPGARPHQASTEISQIGSEPAGQLTPEVVPVALRKLAGDLVLEARERQLARGR